MVKIIESHTMNLDEEDLSFNEAKYNQSTSINLSKYKKDNILLDFDDMVTECYRLLDERRDILQKIREMYPYIMVDEYQDTNRIQYEILKLLAHPNDNLYVVGDDDQSVYGFRGARPDIMLQFENEFPGAKISHLSQNFRCPEKIVKLSSYIISGNHIDHSHTIHFLTQSLSHLILLIHSSSHLYHVNGHRSLEKNNNRP